MNETVLKYSFMSNMLIPISVRSITNALPTSGPEGWFFGATCSNGSVTQIMEKWGELLSAQELRINPDTGQVEVTISSVKPASLETVYSKGDNGRFELTQAAKGLGMDNTFLQPRIWQTRNVGQITAAFMNNLNAMKKADMLEIQLKVECELSATQ